MNGSILTFSRAIEITAHEVWAPEVSLRAARTRAVAPGSRPRSASPAGILGKSLLFQGHLLPCKMGWLGPQLKVLLMTEERGECHREPGEQNSVYAQETRLLQLLDVRPLGSGGGHEGPLCTHVEGDSPPPHTPEGRGALCPPSWTLGRQETESTQERAPSAPSLRGLQWDES